MTSASAPEFPPSRRSWWAPVLAALCLSFAAVAAPVPAVAGTTGHTASAKHQASKHTPAKRKLTKRKAVKHKVVKRKVTRHVAKKHVTKRHVAKKHVTKRHVAKKHVTKRHVARKHVAKRHLAKRHVTKRQVAQAPRKLELRSRVAYVVDQDTGKVVLQKNASAVMPIASLTKLMTGLVISEAKLPMDEKIRISSADVDRLKFSSSHLPVGTELTRRQALHLALMASENRAAHALARTYPGGEPAFVSAMNNKARLLGMEDTRYVEPTGLSSGNHSSARDLAVLAATAYKRPLLREFTTSKAYALAVPGRKLRFHNTNMLVRDPSWKIGLQKTGFINEAGQCLLLRTRVLGHKLVMVLLHSTGHLARIRDAQQVRLWLRSHPHLMPSHDEDETQARSAGEGSQG